MKFFIFIILIILLCGCVRASVSGTVGKNTSDVSATVEIPIGTPK